MKKAIIETSKGNMEVEFYEKDAPKTVKNFTDLIETGFYDGLTFHRVIQILLYRVVVLKVLGLVDQDIV